MEPRILETFEKSLHRCNHRPEFLDIFYRTFLASSPEVREKFKDTDFVRQKRALRASLYLMLLVAADEGKGAMRYLEDMAVSHSKTNLDIGAALYDLWLDSLLATVRECDSHCTPEVEEAWEKIMGIGIQYMLDHYHHPPGAAPRG